ncbi:histone acetyltransferase complex subunit Nto1 [Schizosaccharomyces japonicus yFS275]|uniref:Histone acetyltransferase complex subunit Nto1 n=1 Tax=Schizosaccharomyces japonicus (strain yFS275 / FY16936) TaxID=402676 RepID=B6K0S0_SCHJY|nr:histone acetyltransferase complex subunit Nto1 [Schizosaccharomyces japonicus yFS275]EEB07541.1 histone acetyltransferase complex subunit Nto1 [Schizosaccharomyces japonicus yFS275]
MSKNIQEQLAFQPREEIPYAVFHPTLNIQQPLKIVNRTEYDNLQRFEYYKNGPNQYSSYVVKTLPVAKVQVIEESKVDTSTIQPKYKSFGYVDKQTEKPKSLYHYTKTSRLIRHHVQQFPQVQYDMDELDAMWLTYYNEYMASKHPDWEKLNHEFLEILITMIEREYALLDAQVPKLEPVRTEVEELDGSCSICNESECEHNNAIVFCDSCNLAVHQNCYGIPFVPEGQWFCKKCRIAPDQIISCVCCPDHEGAFRTTVDGRWCHTLCAMAIPEVWFHDVPRLDLVRNVPMIPKSRWKLVCSICKQRWGACVQCTNKSCYVAFHITCARRAGLYYKIHQHSPNYDSVELECYCDKHTSASHLHVGMHKLLPIARKYYTDFAASVPFNYLSCFAAPTVPEPRWTTSHIPLYIVHKIVKFLHESALLKESKFYETITRNFCTYYREKRRSRRNAALLRSEGILTEIANAPVRKEEPPSKRQLEITYALRDSLKQVRQLVHYVHERQKSRTELSRLRKEFVSLVYFPTQKRIKQAYERIRSLDKTSVFDKALDHGWVGWSELDLQVQTFRLSTLEQLRAAFQPLWDLDGIIRSVDDMDVLSLMVQLSQAIQPIAEKEFERALLDVQSLQTNEYGNLVIPSLAVDGLDVFCWPGPQFIGKEPLDEPTDDEYEALKSFVQALDENEKLGMYSEPPQ